ncbi:unnamed protein product [Gadus morhua 'NCC']
MTSCFPLGLACYELSYHMPDALASYETDGGCERWQEKEKARKTLTIEHGGDSGPKPPVTMRPPRPSIILPSPPHPAM